MNHEFDDNCPCAECKRIWDEAISACLKQADGGYLRVVDIGRSDAFYSTRNLYIRHAITSHSLQLHEPDDGWKHGDVTFLDGRSRYFCEVKTEPAYPN